MKYEDNKNLLIDLESIGGNRLFKLSEIVDELIYHRREGFIRQLLTMKDGQECNNRSFDAIGFIAATSDYSNDSYDINYEGNIIYDVIVGNDWVWHCKTTITWKNIIPLAGGGLDYHTDVIPNENVKSHRISAMTGTQMKIRVIKNNLKTLTFEETVLRSLECMKE